MKNLGKQYVSRISVSLPETMLRDMDQMVNDRGFGSRSQALVNMIHQYITEHRHQYGNEIMAGTINLVYDHTIPGLQKQLAELQHNYLDEVISSLHVHLQHEQTMEVILVQGPAQKLKAIADKMQSCHGVTSGTLQLSTAIMPQIHPLPVAEAE